MLGISPEVAMTGMVRVLYTVAHASLQFFLGIQDMLDYLCPQLEHGALPQTNRR